MEIKYGKLEDINNWMDLVKKVKNNFPGLETEADLEKHKKIVEKFIKNKEAICVKENNTIIGVLLFSKKEKILCFLAVDKNYRRQHLGKTMLNKMLENFNLDDEIKVSTYREGVSDGITARLFYKKLGFIEGELTEEFNYPVQIFTLKNKINYKIRNIIESEYFLLDDFLYKAIYIPKNITPPPKEITKLPELQIYIKDFGKFKDDIALVAELNNKIVGIIWTRIMNDYGHIDDKTPSLAMSVDKEYQKRGIGTSLLKNMIEFLKENNYKKVSLSVQKENYAVRLYKKVGFKVITETDEEYIMILEF
ncbi:MAG: GNAT family N-acetyltransferase [Fusobacterium perfoetens]|nr:GNAT family N-acetyltransferase [Fusobacterium perfoetens]MCI6152412.1 GNAT family N-acetyltransferase [Fusobacterium perfoetens]MDY3237011.1 GNAT family N-acetyltransferase [Fusobacterium perfoetens]